jgi:hypothetical protein
LLTVLGLTVATCGRAVIAGLGVLWAVQAFSHVLAVLAGTRAVARLERAFPGISGGNRR